MGKRGGMAANQWVNTMAPDYDKHDYNTPPVAGWFGRGDQAPLTQPQGPGTGPRQPAAGGPHASREGPKNGMHPPQQQRGNTQQAAPGKLPASAPPALGRAKQQQQQQHPPRPSPSQATPTPLALLSRPPSTPSTPWSTAKPDFTKSVPAASPWGAPRAPLVHPKSHSQPPARKPQQGNATNTGSAYRQPTGQGSSQQQGNGANSGNGSWRQPTAQSSKQQPSGANSIQQVQAQASSTGNLYEPLTWATQQSSSHGPMYSHVTREIVDLVTSHQPTTADISLRQVMMQLVSKAVTEALPEYGRQMQVLPFGSFVSGLGTCSSDLDIVVTGVSAPAGGEGFYSKYERPQVARLLDRIARCLRQGNLVINNLLIIRHARIPLVKVTASLRPQSLTSAQQSQLPRTVRPQDLYSAPPLEVDISIATGSGPQAAAHMAEQSRHYPALRPLGLVIKQFLQVLDMNDVATGGLSSYGLTYMVIAHLMEEERASVDQQGALTDLGWLLYRFFMRYGQAFSPHSYCISVREGGVVNRSQVPGMRYTNMERICCIDPLTGRDVTEGCFRSGEVLAALGRAATYFERKATKYTRACPASAHVLDGLMRKPSYHNNYLDDDEEDEEEEEPDRLRPLSRSQSNHTGQPPAKMFAYTYPDQDHQANVPLALPLLSEGLRTHSTLTANTNAWGVPAQGMMADRTRSLPSPRLGVRGDTGWGVQAGRGRGQGWARSGALMWLWGMRMTAHRIGPGTKEQEEEEGVTA